MMLKDDSRNITDGVSSGIRRYMCTTKTLSLSVTARKDWLTTIKSVVTTGETVTAVNRGRTGWQPNQCPL